MTKTNNFKCSITTVKHSEKHRTQLNLDDKYFTDYHPRFTKKYRERKRKTIYAEKPLNNRFITANNKINERCNYNGKKGKDETINGIYAHLSLNELVYAIKKFSANNHYFIFKKKEKGEIIKGHGLCISKLLLQGGISPTKNSICNGSPFLFYDIDVKNKLDKKENITLYSEDGKPNALNNKVFEFMKSISLITARSSSGLGICGVLYCPFLENINNNNLHKEIGITVYRFINENLNPPTQIEFDEAQAQFTQGRMFPVQLSNTTNADWDRVELNKEALEFDVELTHNEESFNKETIKKNSLAKTSEKKESKILNLNNSFSSEFDNKKNVKLFNQRIKCSYLLNISEYYEYVCTNISGFEVYQKVGKNNKSVNINPERNSFTCFTGSLNGYTPFHLYAQLFFKGDFKKTYFSLEKQLEYEKIVEDNYWLDYLEPLSVIYNWQEIIEILNSSYKYSDIYLSEDGVIKSRSKSLVDILGIDERDITNSLHLLLKTRGFEYPIFDILNDKNITSDLKINKYLSPELIINNCTEFINYVFSPCGTGKTTTFLGNQESNIDGMSKNNSVLFIVPRKLMVEQQSKSCKKSHNIISSTGDKQLGFDNNTEYISSIGNNVSKLFDNKNKLRSVITTYDQFVNIPNSIINEYDYVVLDEAHLLASDDFREAISETYLKLKESHNNRNVKYILLSATPSMEVFTLKEYFKNNFKILNIKKNEDLKPCVLINGIDEISKEKKELLIFKQILNDISENRKAIIFCENKEKIIHKINAFKSYCDSICQSTPTIGIISADSKEMNAYKQIVNNEYLEPKVTFTTSVLNVGVNITKGTEGGASFFFDFSSTAHHTSACSLLQLMFRNRNKKTKVHCYAEVFKVDDRKLKTNLVDRFNNFKKNKLYENESIKKRYKFSEVKLKTQNQVSETYIATSDLEKNTKIEQKSLGSFVNLAVKNGCYIDYTYKTIEPEKGIKSDNIINSLVYNILKQLLEIKTNNRIKLINLSEFNNELITPEISIAKSPNKLEDGQEFYECQYNPSLKSIEEKITRCFNFLKIKYGSRNKVKNVLNFILNDKKNKKRLDRKLINYIDTLKIIEKESIISKILLSEIERLEDFSKKKMEYILETKIPSKILSILDDEITNTNLENIHLDLVKNKNFRESFEEYIIGETNKTFKALFLTKEEQKKFTLTEKMILNIEKEKNITEEDFRDILIKLNLNNSIIEENIFDALSHKLSLNYTGVTLDKFKAEFNTSLKDYFNDELHEN
ncbi:DEAD/DEAH box helicase family protein, partial [uncultured Tenacibaculum sp.]|uniref:DEAD/DEAH box helicase n=1 Tax=uncultured Tenacibaculum sp. TaxID=174713 RepID=UPI00261C5EDA